MLSSTEACKNVCKHLAVNQNSATGCTCRSDGQRSFTIRIRCCVRHLVKHTNTEWCCSLPCSTCCLCVKREIWILCSANCPHTPYTPVKSTNGDHNVIPQYPLTTVACQQPPGRMRALQKRINLFPLIIIWISRCILSGCNSFVRTKIFFHKLWFAINVIRST